MMSMCLLFLYYKSERKKGKSQWELHFLFLITKFRDNASFLEIVNYFQNYLIDVSNPKNILEIHKKNLNEKEKEINSWLLALSLTIKISTYPWLEPLMGRYGFNLGCNLGGLNLTQSKDGWSLSCSFFG